MQARIHTPGKGSSWHRGWGEKLRVGAAAALQGGPCIAALGRTAAARQLCTALRTSGKAVD